VNSTNFFYHITAIPGGVYRYFKEGRMAWPLTWVIIVGTLPRVFIGYYFRILYLPDHRIFKVFVGIVLLHIGSNFSIRWPGELMQTRHSEASWIKNFAERAKRNTEQHYAQTVAGIPPETVIRTVISNLKEIEYEFWGERFRFSVPSMFLIALIVGIIGGTYGIGGGAIIAPFCVAVFKLPIYTGACAALLGTFLTSIVGVISTLYSLLRVESPHPQTGCSDFSSALVCLWVCILERGSRNSSLKRSLSSCSAL
jgi:uncharacterized protein